MEPTVFPAKQLQLKRKSYMQELEVHVNINSSGNQKKRPRASKDVSFVYGLNYVNLTFGTWQFVTVCMCGFQIQVHEECTVEEESEA